MDQNNKKIIPKQLTDIHLDIAILNLWLNEYRYNTNTLNNYRNIAHKFTVWLIHQNLSLKKITRNDIQIYQDYLLQGLRNSTINLHLNVLGSMYQYLIEVQYLIINPFRLIKQKLSVNKNQIKYLTISEWDYLLKFLDNPININQARTRWIFTLLYYTGCRRSEIVQCVMSDITIKRNGWWLCLIGKGNKYGEIPLPNKLIIELVKYRNFIGLPDIPNKSEVNIPLITSINDFSLPITASTLYKAMRKTTTKISKHLQSTNPLLAETFGKMSPHWLRHTSATHQFELGVDLRMIKENLRHSSVQTTLKYSHLNQDNQHSETIKNFGKSRKEK